MHTLPYEQAALAAQLQAGESRAQLECQYSDQVMLAAETDECDPDVLAVLFAELDVGQDMFLIDVDVAKERLGLRAIADRAIELTDDMDAVNQLRARLSKERGKLVVKLDAIDAQLAEARREDLRLRSAIDTAKEAEHQLREQCANPALLSAERGIQKRLRQVTADLNEIDEQLRPAAFGSVAGALAASRASNNQPAVARHMSRIDQLEAKRETLRAEHAELMKQQKDIDEAKALV